MKPTYSISEIRTMWAEIIRLNLKVPEGFWKLSELQIQAIANGVGPCTWSRTERRLLTYVQSHFAIAALIHDIYYCSPNKDRSIFNKANSDFLHNMKILAKDKASWYNPLRYIMLINAQIDYISVQDGGWKAWITGDVLTELSV